MRFGVPLPGIARVSQHAAAYPVREGVMAPSKLILAQTAQKVHAHRVNRGTNTKRTTWWEPVPVSIKSRTVRFAVPSVALVLFLSGVLADGRIDRTDIRAAGVFLLAMAAFIAVQRQARTRGAGGEGAGYELGYREGHEDGKREGHREGRRAARPVIVPLRPASAAASMPAVGQQRQAGREGTA